MSSLPHDSAPLAEPSQNSIRSSPSPGDEQPIRPEPTYLYLGDHSKLDNSYGFRIYRTTYGDDKKWDRFMAYFKANVERSLGRDEKYKHQLPRVDWIVQSSPGLQDATIDQVRDYFVRWLTSGEEQPDNSARFLACVVVDDDSLESVSSKIEFLEEEGLPLDDDDEEGIAYVKLVSVNDKEGDVPVCIQYLYPRVFSFLQGLGWEFIVGGEREFSARP